MENLFSASQVLANPDAETNCERTAIETTRDLGKHTAITKTILDYKMKYYNRNTAQLVRRWVTTCVNYVRE